MSSTQISPYLYLCWLRFTRCLDSPKSGDCIKRGVFLADSKKWNCDLPESMQKADETMQNQYKLGVSRPSKRLATLRPFILNTLEKYGKELTDNAMVDYKNLCAKAKSSGTKDEDLAGPYNETKEWATRKRNKDDPDWATRKKNKDDPDSPFKTIERIEAFVKLLCEEYVLEAGSCHGSRSPRKKGVSLSAAKAKSINHINSEYAKRFASEFSDFDQDLPPGSVKEVKASYAYVYSTSTRIPDSPTRKAFPFVVAHETLCAIKIQTKGGSSVSRECSDFQLTSSNLVKSALH